MILISTSSAQEQQAELENKNTARGLVVSKNIAALGVDINAKVTKIPFKVGEAFNSGDTLLSFDCTVQKAESEAAYAVYTATKATHNSNVEMLKHSAVGEYEVELSKAEMRGAAAKWRASKGRMNNCEIKAPFSGKVAAISVNEHEFPSTDQPIMKIVGDKDFDLQFIVPSKWLAWLQIADTFNFKIDETNKVYRAKITRIGAQVDAVSGTIELFGVFIEGSENVLPGMSGLATFAKEE